MLLNLAKDSVPLILLDLGLAHKGRVFSMCKKDFSFHSTWKTSYISSSVHCCLTRQHGIDVSWTFLHISIIWYLIDETHQHRHPAQPGKPGWVGYKSNVRAQESASFVSIQCRGQCLITPLRDALESQPRTAALPATSKLCSGHTLVLNPGIPNACLCPSYVFAVPQWTPVHTEQGRPSLGGWRCRAAPRAPTCPWDSAFCSKENTCCLHRESLP